MPPPHYDSISDPKGTIDLLLDILGRLRAKSKAIATSSEETINADARADNSSSDKSPLNSTAPRATFGAMIEELDERAYGILLLVLALPCCLPFVYILPQIVSLPMLAICAQLAAGRPTPWLPEKLSSRDFGIDDFEGVVKKGAKYIGWFEKVARPRLIFLTQGLGLRIIGALLLIPCASIMVPLPSTNTVPGISVAIASIGLIERDGVLVLMGLICGLLWVFILAFLGFEASQILKDFISSRI